MTSRLLRPHAAVYMVGQKLFLRVDNFATVNGRKACNYHRRKLRHKSGELMASVEQEPIVRI